MCGEKSSEIDACSICRVAASPYPTYRDNSSGIAESKKAIFCVEGALTCCRFESYKSQKAKKRL